MAKVSLSKTFRKDAYSQGFRFLLVMQDGAYRVEQRRGAVDTLRAAGIVKSYFYLLPDR